MFQLIACKKLYLPFFLCQKKYSKPRVETKMHFFIFAKIRKSCENGQIFAKFHKISFRENISFSRKFSRKFQKFFAKMKNAEVTRTPLYLFI
jgi:hypothetical protein